MRRSPGSAPERRNSPSAIKKDRLSKGIREGRGEEKKMGQNFLL